MLFIQFLTLSKRGFSRELLLLSSLNGESGVTFLEGKSGNLSANPMFQKESGKICLSLSEKSGEKVAVSVTAKVSEISDTSTDGLGVTC